MAERDPAQAPQPAAAPARVIWVDDDPSVRRLIEMALEPLGLDLCMCVDAPQARQALLQRPAELLVTDLMMPGESGLCLIASLASLPEPRPRLMIFSARSDLPDAQEQARLGIWRILAKPAPLVALLDSVKEALMGGAASPPPASASPAAGQGAARRERALRELFGGNAELFDRFEAGVLQQLPQEIASGDAAAQDRDPTAMLHLVHNLKGMLQALGHDEQAARAREFETALLAGRRENMLGDWQRLRQQLLELPADSPTPPAPI